VNNAHQVKETFRQPGDKGKEDSMTQNMHTMLQGENSVSKSEIEWAQWNRRLRKSLGRDFDENGIAFDLYKDGCTPEEAALEMKESNYD